MAAGIVECELVMGRWTIRVGGVFVIDFNRFQKGKAMQLAFNLSAAIENARKFL